MVLDYLVGKYEKVKTYVPLVGAVISAVVAPFGSSNAIAQEAYQAFRNPQAGIEQVVEQDYDSNILQQRKGNSKKTVNFTITDMFNEGYLDGAVVTPKDMDGNPLPRVSVNNGYAKLKLDKGTKYHIEISHPSYHTYTIEEFMITRHTKLNIGLIPGTYPLDFLAEVGMNNPDAEIQNGTVKPDSKKRPTYRINLGYYLDKDANIIEGNAFKPEQIDFIEKTINTEIKDITQDCFDDNNDFVIERSTSLPVLDKNGVIMYEDGVIDIMASYFFSGGAHGEKVRKQTIVSAGIELNPNLDANSQGAQGVIREELFQNYGARNDTYFTVGVNSILSRKKVEGNPEGIPISNEFGETDYQTQTIICKMPKGLTYPNNTLEMINNNEQYFNHSMNHGKILKTTSRENIRYLKMNNPNNYSSHRQQKGLRRAA